MSITVMDVLRLPSLSGAEVLAGHDGLSKPVESVNVLEYGDITDELDQLFENNQFDGNELIITAFANIRNNVEAQCCNIRRYHNIGAVGIILYYVEILLPRVDPALIDLCNELSFPLICMPKGQLNLRYSEAIGEILAEIIYARQRERYFVSELLHHVSNLPPHQRNIETLMRMLSDHLHATVILTSPLSHPPLCVCWPRSLIDVVQANATEWICNLEEDQPLRLSLGESDYYLQSCPVLSDDPGEYHIYLLKNKEPLSEDTLWQTSESIRLFIHIWNKNYGKLVTTEIVRAIIHDDALQMNRLSQLFNVDVSQLNQMWLFHPKDNTRQYNEKLVRQISEHFSSYYDLILTSYYEENLVFFTCAPVRYDQRKEMLRELSPLLLETGEHAEIVCCDCLPTTKSVREAYLNSVQYMDSARKIYPKVQILGLPNILFAKRCSEILSKQGDLEPYWEILEQLRESSNVLLPTAEIYLLDAASNMAQTAKYLFVHLNTVKYRLHLIQDILGCVPGRMPDADQLYIAVALNRLIKK